LYKDNDFSGEENGEEGIVGIVGEMDY